MVSLIYRMAELNAHLDNITKAPLLAEDKKIRDTIQTAKAGIKRFTKIDGVQVEKTLKKVEKVVEVEVSTVKLLKQVYLNLLNKV